jgi:serine/threonine protein kinase
VNQSTLQSRKLSIVIGTQILHYQILRKLGAGGMGIVYEALDTKLERNVALKFLTDGLTHNPQAMQRFEREAKAVSRLDHPNIGAVFALEQNQDQQFLAMAMYQGTTLAQRLEQGEIPILEAIRIALEIARGLEHAHGQNVIHRDIKPANIFLARMPNNNELVKILDFGLARLEDASRQLTRPGATTGTLLYMAPEQLSGKADALTDTWAWGAVVYETLTGRTPFNVDGIGALLNAILNTEPTKVEQHRPEIPSLVSSMVMQALQKNPTARPQTMTEIVTTLETFFSNSGERTYISSSQNAVVSLALSKENPAPNTTTRNPESLLFENPSSWDKTPQPTNPVIDTTQPSPKPKPRPKPWLLTIPTAIVIAIGTWLLIPKPPTSQPCTPLNNTGAMIDSAIKWSAPLIPLENCGTFGYGNGSATSEYNGATQVKRQVLALLPGTVLVADTIQYPEVRNLKTLIGLKSPASQNTQYQGSGTQYQTGKGKNFTTLYPSSLEITPSGDALAITSNEPNTQHLTLNIFQVDEIDTEIQRLDVTTSDEHTQNFVGALFGSKTAVFLGIGTKASASSFNVNVPPGITRYIITGLTPGSSYDMEFEPDRGWNYITLKNGTAGTVNSAGVLVLGEGMQQLR